MEYHKIEPFFKLVNDQFLGNPTLDAFTSLWELNTNSPTNEKRTMKFSHIIPFIQLINEHLLGGNKLDELKLMWDKYTYLSEYIFFEPCKVNLPGKSEMCGHPVKEGIACEFHTKR
jgi:hypothetical protein